MDRAKAHCRNYTEARYAYLHNGSPESQAQFIVAHQKWINTYRELGLSLFQVKVLERDAKKELRDAMG